MAEIKHKNTVKGVCHGKKRELGQKESCIAWLLAGESTLAVAKKFNVPESTLRTWRTAAIKKLDDGSDISKMRKAKAGEIAELSTKGAIKSARILNKRLDRTAKIDLRIDKVIEELMQCEDETRATELGKNLYILTGQKMTDFSLTNIYKTLIDKGISKGEDDGEKINININTGDNYAE